MNASETAWLEKARANAPRLRALVESWHPGRPLARGHGMEITAINAEAACREVRRRIAEQEQAEEKPPVARFDEALANGDVGDVYTLLNSAWMGVPESTDCWRIEGFAEAVDLLEDPPEPDRDDATLTVEGGR